MAAGSNGGREGEPRKDGLARTPACMCERVEERLNLRGGEKKGILCFHFEA